ncbi:MAG: hypothetical protein AB8H03_10375 [Saprospiraceae bacterium]
MVLVLLKVQRNDFNKLNQANLSVFGQLVVGKTDGNAKYQVMETQVADLKAKSLAYDQALVAAANRGTEFIQLKNIAKQALLVSFNLFANALELYADGNEDFIIETGLSVRAKPTKSTLPLQVPQKPTNIFVKSTGNVGELMVHFELPNKEHVITVAAEHRIVNVDAPYTNGKYFSGVKGLMKNLPSQSMVEVRFNAIGRDDLKSGWTTPIVVPVL